MVWAVGLASAILVCFGFVLLVGAPYLPTLTPQVKRALDMLDLQPGQTMLELGCGDGKVLIAAAERGLKCVGYELNPIMAAIAWLRTRRYGKSVRIVCRDFWGEKWPKADGIFAFALPRLMRRLDGKIEREVAKPVRLVSFAFTIPDKKPTRQEKGLYQYDYR